jgi:phage-related protein
VPVFQDHIINYNNRRYHKSDNGLCNNLIYLEGFVEIAKFVFTAIGTFLSVFALSFSVFQYWKKKQDEKFDHLETETKESIKRMGSRIEVLEQQVLRNLENRLSLIEGELKGLKPILQSIQNWFINNTGTR